MTSAQGFYAILQYSPAPERYEFVNIGVVLFVPGLKHIGIKFSRTQKRVAKLFGRQPKYAYDAVKAGLAKRIRSEFSGDFDAPRFEMFSKTRANKTRVTTLLPIVVDSPAVDLDELFHQLVGEEETSRRLPRIAYALKMRFERAGVTEYLQKNPPPVRLPQGVTIEVPYAYRNGSLNLIDPVRLGGNTSDALGEASKRAIESEWLREYSRDEGDPKELFVVGDFSGQSRQFVEAVKDLMVKRNVKLYDLHCGLEPLLEDIRRNATQRPLADTE